MEASITILGTSSATPTKTRFHSGQYLRFGADHVLIDCGEGTQNRLLQYGLSFQKINHIFITHMHGDHFLGLPGLINTMQLNQRSRPLNVYGPPELKDVLDLHFKAGRGQLTFEINHHEISDGLEVTLKDLKCTVVEVVHRIPCFAFRFDQHFPRKKLNLNACLAYNIPTEAYHSITEGQNYVTADGKTIANKLLTKTPEPGFSYGYVTDTLYKPELCKHFNGIRLLYHEATYLSNLIDRAVMTYHSTALEAGKFALQSAVKQLIIGHFSSRYDALNDHLSESRSVFPQTILAVEGETIVVD